MLAIEQSNGFKRIPSYNDPKGVSSRLIQPVSPIVPVPRNPSIPHLDSNPTSTGYNNMLVFTVDGLYTFMLVLLALIIVVLIIRELSLPLLLLSLSFMIACAHHILDETNLIQSALQIHVVAPNSSFILMTEYGQVLPAPEQNAVQSEVVIEQKPFTFGPLEEEEEDVMMQDHNRLSYDPQSSAPSSPQANLALPKRELNYTKEFPSVQVRLQVIEDREEGDDLVRLDITIDGFSSRRGSHHVRRNRLFTFDPKLNSTARGSSEFNLSIQA
eukprot:CAMPEP_0184482814 /NCGR_PEP_ID=MMETSP0113_2-20130426/4408_1 /TAXON_ID=91329 /ORGANISM="Norrisiella sphaerica, Strain BC52" /LENGTH=270 /DNA_ID=CAMNT_0026862803 /DNA_START=318 /DNA_END=1130 /DNA_ORIENTATION=-